MKMKDPALVKQMADQHRKLTLMFEVEIANMRKRAAELEEVVRNTDHSDPLHSAAFDYLQALNDEIVYRIGG